MPVVPPGSVPGTVPEMQDRARTWLPPQTSHWRDWPAERLMTAKQRTGTRISVVIPARNEERTVGRVVGTLRQALLTDTPLVDEIIVIDSDSTDGTGRAAGRAGATVHRARDIAPELGSYPGKGEALWKSLLVTRGDLLVFVDADLTHWGTHFVTGLLGPLLGDPGVLLVKGFYERLYQAGDGSVTAEFPAANAGDLRQVLTAAGEAFLVGVEVGHRFLGEAPAVIAVAGVPVDQPEALDLAADGGDLLRPGADDVLARLFQLRTARLELVAAGQRVHHRLHLAHCGGRQVAHLGEGVQRLVVGEDPLAAPGLSHARPS